MAKLLFVSEYCGIVGGIERYMAQSAHLLRKDGHEVDCLCFAKAQDEMVFRANFSGSISYADLMRKKPSYDLVVVHKIRSAEILRGIKKHYRVVIFVHDHEFYCPRRSYYRPFTRNNCRESYSWLRCTLCSSIRRPRKAGELLTACGLSFSKLWTEIKTSEKFIVISGFMRDNLVRQGIEPGRIAIIPPAISIDDRIKEEKVKPTTPHLLVVGQLIKGKGVDQLLQALPLVKNDCVLDILGNGNDENNLKAMAVPLGDKVRFHGWVRTPEQYFAQAYLEVLPWRWQEPFGLVGPEALAQGIPLVGFNVGGIGEYLIDGDTGLLAPPGDIQALAGAIDRLLSAPELTAQMGENGRKLVMEKYSREKFLGGWNLLIEKKI